MSIANKTNCLVSNETLLPILKGLHTLSNTPKTGEIILWINSKYVLYLENNKCSCVFTLLNTKTNSIKILAINFIIFIYMTIISSEGGGGKGIVSETPILLFPCSIVSETHIKNCFKVLLSAVCK